MLSYRRMNVWLGLLPFFFSRITSALPVNTTDTEPTTLENEHKDTLCAVFMLLVVCSALLIVYAWDRFKTRSTAPSLDEPNPSSVRDLIIPVLLLVAVLVASCCVYDFQWMPYTSTMYTLSLVFLCAGVAIALLISKKSKSPSNTSSIIHPTETGNLIGNDQNLQQRGNYQALQIRPDPPSLNWVVKFEKRLNHYVYHNPWTGKTVLTAAETRSVDCS